MKVRSVNEPGLSADEAAGSRAIESNTPAGRRIYSNPNVTDYEGVVKKLRTEVFSLDVAPGRDL